MTKRIDHAVADRQAAEDTGEAGCGWRSGLQGPVPPVKVHRRRHRGAAIVGEALSTPVTVPQHVGPAVVLKAGRCWLGGDGEGQVEGLRRWAGEGGRQRRSRRQGSRGRYAHCWGGTGTGSGSRRLHDWRKLGVTQRTQRSHTDTPDLAKKVHGWASPVTGGIGPCVRTSRGSHFVRVGCQPAADRCQVRTITWPLHGCCLRWPPWRPTPVVPCAAYAALVARDARFDGGSLSADVHWDLLPARLPRAPTQARELPVRERRSRPRLQRFRPCMKCRPELALRETERPDHHGRLAHAGLPGLGVDTCEDPRPASSSWRPSRHHSAGTCGASSAEHGVTPLQYR